LIAGAYLAGTNTRRVRRALTAVFGRAISKDMVSRAWRKVKNDWDAWNARSLADEPIIRLILDGTVVRVRFDKKATSIRCSSLWAYARMGKRFSWQSKKWAWRARPHGGRFSTISSVAVCRHPRW
jgi:hypothetical protein